MRKMDDFEDDDDFEYIDPCMQFPIFTMLTLFFAFLVVLFIIWILLKLGIQS